MNESIDDVSQNIMTAYVAQMESAIKISQILSEHNNDSDELSGDDIICGLIYRLMIPMSNSEMVESLEEAKKIMVNASIDVVGGPIRVDQEIIKGNYVQLKNGEPNKDQMLFDKIMEYINSYTRTESKVHP